MPTIDPSRAAIDFDAMSLKSFNMALAPNVRGPQGEPLGAGVKVHVVLTGGLGRMQVAIVGNRFTDNVESVTADGIFLGLTEEKLEDLKDLLKRWVDWQIPLRYLDFGDRSMILEDSDNFVILPPGMRTIKIINGPNASDA